MYPRATVNLALLLSGLDVLDRENAEICDVSVRAIRHWRYGTRRHDPAGRRKRACPRCDGQPLDRQAYAYLLGLYLGDGHITLGRRDVYTLSLTCCDAWPGLVADARAVLAAVMPASRVFCVQRVGCTEVKSASKHWPCLFPQHGPGRKHKRLIALEPWQVKIITVFPGDFARGLFHSDGCRVLNRVRRPLPSEDRWYEYPRYFFSNESGDILRLCGDALDRLGADWRYSRPNMISVARRAAVARLDQFVGPKY
jgi:hypothetical protein